MDAYVIVEVAQLKVAFPAWDVEQVLRAVAITPAPPAPGRLDGAIDLDGERVEVVSLREWLGVPPAAPATDAHLVILRCAGRRVALNVDRVVDLAIVEPDAVVATTWSGPGVVTAALRLPGGLAVVPQLDALAGGRATPGP
jgi:purine-binding chemotaxis protein CheW